ncbi:salivary endonuclease-like [Musca autumnalis]|uniref:salivary endonuclease-like n=1 Tax=Musca autumnalis TaxID=221902 RepID=UPI003CF5EB5C
MKNKICSQLFRLSIWLIIANEVLAENCKLTDANMDRKWIFLQDNDLLHSDTIKDGETLTLYCNERTNPVDLTCRHGTLDPMPGDAVCNDRLKLSVEPKFKSCHQLGISGQLYDVVYRFSTGLSIDLYTICYSTSSETVVYSIHKSYYFDLPTKNYQRPQFKLTGNPNRARSSSFDADAIFATFKRLLGDQQTYVKSDRDFAVQRGHMANSQDFLTYDQMDATFLYMNVVPMSRGCNLRNWKRIENWIHRKSESTILTGTHDVLYLQHSQTQHLVPIYLMPQQKNPMPLWLYKVVKLQHLCYVFVTLNDHSGKPAVTDTNICRHTSCPEGITFDNDPEACHSYCCDYFHFVEKVGQHVNLCPNLGEYLRAQMFFTVMMMGK